MDTAKLTNTTWEEIHDFSSLSEYNRFLIYIEEQIKAGYTQEVEPDLEYGRGEIYGGRWFEDIESGELWRLIPPDFPFRGLWEPVRCR